MIKAVLFDLDGTLLPLDVDLLMKAYMRDLVAFMAPHVSPDRLESQVYRSIGAMVGDTDGATTNYQAFAASFFPAIGIAPEVLEPHMAAFFREAFPRLRAVAAEPRGGRRAVQSASEAGLRLILATNAVFPRSVIEERMRWAEVHDFDWELVTCYDSMHACKPHAAYYEEILSRTGLDPAACLMVGNDVEEDMLPAMRLGMSTFLVTGFVRNRRSASYDGPSGDLSALVEHLERLSR